MADSDDQALLARLRSLMATDYARLDAAIQGMSDSERAALAIHLTRFGTHLSTCSTPPPLTPPGTDRIDLSVQPSAALVAALFVRNTLHRWQWADVLVDAEHITGEFINAFVAAVETHGPPHPTRMTLRLRAVSANRLLVELADSPDNAASIARTGNLISVRVEQISVRHRRRSAHGRTCFWSELARPGLQRWI